MWLKTSALRIIKKIMHVKEINFKEREVAMQSTEIAKVGRPSSFLGHADVGSEPPLSIELQLYGVGELPVVIEDSLSLEVHGQDVVDHGFETLSVVGHARGFEFPQIFEGIGHPIQKQWKKLARETGFQSSGSRGVLGKRDGVSSSSFLVVILEGSVKKTKVYELTPGVMLQHRRMLVYSLVDFNELSLLEL